MPLTQIFFFSPLPILGLSLRNRGVQQQRSGNEGANKHYPSQGWSECVSFGDFSSYKDRFERCQEYFAPRFADATRVGNEMIKTILDNM